MVFRGRATGCRDRCRSEMVFRRSDSFRDSGDFRRSAQDRFDRDSLLRLAAAPRLPGGRWGRLTDPCSPQPSGRRMEPGGSRMSEVIQSNLSVPDQCHRETPSAISSGGRPGLRVHAPSPSPDRKPDRKGSRTTPPLDPGTHEREHPILPRGYRLQDSLRDVERQRQIRSGRAGCVSPAAATGSFRRLPLRLPIPETG